MQREIAKGAGGTEVDLDVPRDMVTEYVARIPALNNRPSGILVRGLPVRYEICRLPGRQIDRGGRMGRVGSQTLSEPMEQVSAQ